MRILSQTSNTSKALSARSAFNNCIAFHWAGRFPCSNQKRKDIEAFNHNQHRIHFDRRVLGLAVTHPMRFNSRARKNALLQKFHRNIDFEMDFENRLGSLLWYGIILQIFKFIFFCFLNISLTWVSAGAIWGEKQAEIHLVGVLIGESCEATKP